MHPKTLTNANFAWGGLVAESLDRLGVMAAVICPGSRSAPLTVGCALHETLEAIPCLDERSAGFFALGLAKRTGRPVALVCTSGTAVANFLPAVVEAHYTGIPLLLLTADRPPELRDRAAGQAVDQAKIFGGYVRWFHELALPDILRMPYLLDTMQHAVTCALGGLPGPVHLNFPFRDPLTPESDPSFSLPEHLMSLLDELHPLPQVLPNHGPSTQSFNALQRDLLTPGFGLLLAGEPLTPRPTAEANATGLIALAEAAALPVFVDVLHPARHFGDNDRMIYRYEELLRAPDFPSIEFALVDGCLPTSKTLRQRLAADGVRLYFTGDATRNRNAVNVASAYLGVSTAQLAEQISALATRPPERATALADLCGRLPTPVEAPPEEVLSEMTVMKVLAHHLPSGTHVFVASSTPIRDAEWFWPNTDRHFEVVANRGANGIDGTLSSALGFAHHADQPAVLVSGDLAFLHDVNGLLVAKELVGSLTIVLIDNHGGGIFQNLPIAQHDPPFEQFFATPQTIDWCALAAAHDIECRSVETHGELAQMVATLPSQGLRLIVVRSFRRDAAHDRKTLLNALKMR